MHAGGRDVGAGDQAERALASGIVGSLGAMRAASVGGGAKPIVSFGTAATGCTGRGDVVVPIKKKKGKLAIRMMTSTGTGKGTRDPDTLVVVCTQ